MPTSAPPLVRPLAGNAGEPVALRDGRSSYDWVEIDTLSHRAAIAMRRDVGSMDRRVAVFAQNAVEPVLAYLAGLRAGLSPVPINFHLTAEECAYILKDSDAGILLVGPENAETGLSAARMAGVPTVVGWRCGPTLGLIAWDAWLDNSGIALERTTPAKPYLHYTSGTTGRPKGTETPPALFPRGKDVAGLFEAYRDWTQALPVGPSLIVGPLCHTGPLNSVRYLAGGKPLVILERFDAEAVLRTISRFRVSTVTMVPTHFQRLLALPQRVRASYDLSSLAVVSHTGAACPPDVKRAMIEWLGPIFTEAYGATECGSTNVITSQEWLERPGSVGRTQPGFEVLVVNDDGKFLDAGEVGQIYFRDKSGRGVMFHNDPEKTNAVHIAPGVFTLGDIGYVDSAGYVYITDRASDMIVSGGVNIYPAEIEAVLAAHPDVEDSAVIGVPNREMGEEVKALVVVRQGRTLTREALLDLCRQRLAGYKRPRSFDFVSQIGRNAMGKVDKRALRRRFWPSDRIIGG